MRPRSFHAASHKAAARVVCSSEWAHSSSKHRWYQEAGFSEVAVTPCLPTAAVHLPYSTQQQVYVSRLHTWSSSTMCCAVLAVLTCIAAVLLLLWSCMLCCCCAAAVLLLLLLLLCCCCAAATARDCAGGLCAAPELL
jgi:hypothetical protein